jgi:hypothetical protein
LASSVYYVANHGDCLLRVRSLICVKSGVVDRHRFDVDPDTNFHFDADLDPDPDPKPNSVFFDLHSKQCQSTLFSRHRHRCYNFQYFNIALKFSWKSIV